MIIYKKAWYLSESKTIDQSDFVEAHISVLYDLNTTSFQSASKNVWLEGKFSYFFFLKFVFPRI